LPWTALWKSGRVFSGRVFSGRVFSGRVFSGRVFSGRVFSGRVFSGRVFSGRVFSGKVIKGRARVFVLFAPCSEGPIVDCYGIGQLSSRDWLGLIELRRLRRCLVLSKFIHPILAGFAFEIVQPPCAGLLTVLDLFAGIVVWVTVTAIK